MNQIKAVQEAKAILRAAALKTDKLSLLQERSVSSLQSKTADHDCAILSAFRGEMVEVKNKTRSTDLKRALMACHYNLAPVSASYVQSINETEEKQVDETSFFVQNQHDDEDFFQNILKLATKYDQDIVLIIPRGGEGAYLVGTTKRGDSQPGFGQKDHLGDSSFDKAIGKYFSIVGGSQLEFKVVNVLTEDEVNFTYPRANGMLGHMGENLRGLEILSELGIVPQKFIKTR